MWEEENERCDKEGREEGIERGKKVKEVSKPFYTGVHKEDRRAAQRRLSTLAKGKSCGRGIGYEEKTKEGI